MNLGALKESLTSYYEGGQFFADCRRLTEEWWSHFESLAPRLSQLSVDCFNVTENKDLILFDVDETILDNYPEMIKIGYGA
jgi:hypothetical protein